MLPEEDWQQVKEIFQTAIELPPSERREFVAARCVDRVTLRAEVESMLEAHDEAGDFFSSTGVASARNFFEEKDLSRVGQTFGSYRIEKEIGRGGMGAVYLAVRADDQFQKQVAIKLIKRGFDTDEIVSRFRAERQILATLEHPNITRLIDGGVTEDGLPYLVMDFVEGLPLTKYCDAANLSIEDRLNVFQQICSAVAHAHRNLVIHRDIKPSNVLVTAAGTPKLLDFGIAKLTVPDAASQTGGLITRTRAMTPEYAAPEQVLGLPVSTAADIYSLGVVLYELLTGHRPLDTANASVNEVARLVTETVAQKPSSVCKARGIEITVRNAQSSIRELQGDLDNIILMAIRKEPERRYPSVEQFSADIQRHLDGLPVIAQEDTFAYRAEKFIKRNKTAVVAGSGLLLSLLGGLAATRRQSKIAGRQRDKAEKVNRYLQKMLASADPYKQGKDVKVVEILHLASQNIERDFAGEPTIIADLRTTLGLTFLNLGQIEPAESHLRFALDTRMRLFGPTDLQTASSQNNFGKLLQAKGDLAHAEEMFRTALRTMDRSRYAEDLEIASVCGNLGYLLLLKARYEEARAAHTRELEIRRVVQGENHPEYARTLSNLGNVFAATGDRATAEPMHRRALSVMRNYYGVEHPDVALAMLHLVGSIQFSKPDEAEQLCRDSLAMRLKFFGEGHIEVAWSSYYLVLVLFHRDEYREAAQLAKNTLAWRGKTLPDSHSVINSLLLMLARCYLRMDQAEEAEPLLLECLDLRRQTLPADHWLISTTKNYLAQCLFQLGRLGEAEPLMRESYSEIVAKLGADNEHSIKARGRLERLDAAKKRDRLERRPL